MLNYTMQGDYNLPNIKLPESKDYQIGMWGQRYAKYLKRHHKVTYYNMLVTRTLMDRLAEVDSYAEDLFERIVKSLAEKENVTEKLKASDPMRWVREMNNIRHRATEIVNAEIMA